MRVTFDTNVRDQPELLERAATMGWDVSVSSVTDRELAAAMIGLQAGIARAPAVFVLSESPLGGPDTLGGGEDGGQLEDILEVVSNGSFPSRGERAELSSGERRQLRDAMIFQSHIRWAGDIFVTNDSSAFIKGSRRARLETTYGTRVMTSVEFGEFLKTYEFSD